MSEKDGGPAFPVMEIQVGGSYLPGHAGMALRDWFAGMALSGYGFNAYPEDAARNAYAQADAMLLARKEKSDG